MKKVLLLTLAALSFGALTGCSKDDLLSRIEDLEKQLEESQNKNQTLEKALNDLKESIAKIKDLESELGSVKLDNERLQSLVNNLQLALASLEANINESNRELVIELINLVETIETLSAGNEEILAQLQIIKRALQSKYYISVNVVIDNYVYEKEDTVYVLDGKNALDALQVANEVEYEIDPVYGAFITEINGDSASAVCANAWWSFEVNGEASIVGVSSYNVQQNDVLKFSIDTSWNCEEKFSFVEMTGAGFDAMTDGQYYYVNATLVRRSNGWAWGTEVYLIDHKGNDSKNIYSTSTVVSSTSTFSFFTFPLNDAQTAAAGITFGEKYVIRITRDVYMSSRQLGFGPKTCYSGAKWNCDFTVGTDIWAAKDFKISQILA